MYFVAYIGHPTSWGWLGLSDGTLDSLTGLISSNFTHFGTFCGLGLHPLIHGLGFHLQAPKHHPEIECPASSNLRPSKSKRGSAPKLEEELAETERERERESTSIGKGRTGIFVL